MGHAAAHTNCEEVEKKFIKERFKKFFFSSC